MASKTRRTCLYSVVRLVLVLPIFGNPVAALAQESNEPASPSNFGGAGLLEMRTARSYPDGYLVLTTNFAVPDDRYAVTFQGVSWAELTFRYSINTGIHDLGATLHDRSFDIKIRLSNETKLLPAIAMGFQDILGTGVYSGEYLVGSKRWGAFDVSLGLGWGRLASRGTFENPLGLFSKSLLRRSTDFGEGGLPLLRSYFRGPDMGLFGGVEYATPIRNLSLKIEYSSDAYLRESAETGINYGAPINFGITYRPAPWLDFGLSYLHGRTVGLRLSVLLDPTSEVWPVRLDPAPRFRSRGAEPASTLLQSGLQPASPTALSTPEMRSVDLTQTDQSPVAIASPALAPVTVPTPTPTPTPVPPSDPNLLDAAAKPSLETAATEHIRMGIDKQRITMLGVVAENDKIQIVIENARYRRDSEAIARTARILSAEAPPQFNYFEITMSRSGQPLTTITIPRTEIDKLANNQGSQEELRLASELEPGRAESIEHIQQGLFPQFGSFAYPVFRQSLFDPDNPVYVEFGIGVSAGLRLSRGWFLEGVFVASLYDDFNQIRRQSNSVLPHVRSDLVEYLQQGKYGLENLSTTYMFKLAPEIYGRFTAGYLERMFAGIGGELLYRPFGKRWAVGVDLWSVRQRGFDIRLDLRNHDAITGHFSFYYDLPWHDVRAIVSTGQYLAGDKGVTFQLTRRFSTGIQVGAWATFTNVSAEQFGEGSFDKGIRIVIPFEWAAPFATQSSYDLGLRPIQRDGGQRLDGDTILYGVSDPADYGALSREWGSVFK